MLMVVGKNRYPGFKKARRNRIEVGCNAHKCTKQEKYGCLELVASARLEHIKMGKACSQ